jgi:hypothetical protein
MPINVTLDRVATPMDREVFAALFEQSVVRSYCEASMPPRSSSAPLQSELYRSDFFSANATTPSLVCPVWARCEQSEVRPT